MKRPNLLVIVAIALAVAVGGCGTQSAAPAASGPAVTVTVTVAGGKVRTPGRRVAVRRGRTVRIVVTSDTADEFHLHGYDRELELKPGVPGVLRFVADQPGVFEAELHGSGARAFQLRVS
jgi:heme/copper-type cytochrome/quinol oxidase subunit 2